MIAPANTGNDNSKRTAVMRIDQTNKDIVAKVTPDARMFMIVEMKLMAPRIDEMPAKCNLKMVRSTEAEEWNVADESGG